jgi:AcrR family transcriptional regulator
VSLGRPRTFDTDAVLDKAMQVFWRLGYEGASLTELTKAMGIGAPSLYAAFGSKEGLFKAVLDHYEDHRRHCLSEILSAPNVRTGTERLLYGLADFVTDPDAPPGCLLLQGGLSCGTFDIPRELARRRASVEHILEERFTLAKQHSELPVGTEPAALARYFSVVCNGIAVHAAAGATREELHDVVRIALRCWPPSAGESEAVSESADALSPV